MKKCPDCKFTKSEEFWSKTNSRCRDCQNARSREDLADMRRAVLKLMGGHCTCCGETEQVFLDIDHINNDGNVDRKKRRGVQTWRLALKQPERFQLLCRNCNWAKYLGGCPHITRTGNR